jgi:hypothetical protein
MPVINWLAFNELENQFPGEVSVNDTYNVRGRSVSLQKRIMDPQTAIILDHGSFGGDFSTSFDFGNSGYRF